MDGFRLNFKFPRWIIIVYIIWFLYGISNIVLGILNNEYINIKMDKTNDFDVFMIIIDILFILFPLFGLYCIIKTNLFNKYYYNINSNGIYNNQLNLLKKYLQWNSELCYLITDNFFSLYSSKKMLPLEGKMINKDNCHKYISIKTKDALKIKRDNKGWICIPVKYLKNKIQTNDIVDMINKSRGINE